MKSRILLLLLLFPVYLFSQNYIPIPADSTSEWRYYHQWHFKSDPCLFYDDYRVFINGDTIINGKTYKKMYKTGKHGETPLGPNSNCNPPVIYSNVYAASIRSDSGKVYLIKQYYNSELLMFDFTLGVGDTVPYFGDENNTIINIDSVLINNRYHKRFFVDTNMSLPIDSMKYIIEGVGSSGGFFNPWHWESNTDFYCYAENHQVIFPAGANCVLNIGVNKTPKPITKIRVYPNPTNNVLNFEMSDKTNNEIAYELGVYNILGEIVLTKIVSNNESLNIEQLNQGVYFIRFSKGNKLLYSSRIIKL